MQATANSALDLTIGIYRRTVTQDAAGRVTPTYPNTATYTVAGNLAQPTAGQLANYGYRVGSLAAWQVRMPIGTDVRATDRLLVNGQVLEVQVVLAPQTYETSLLLIASEVK